MDFCEKLSRLLTISETRGNELARYVNLDSSQISRIKTGVRGKPSQISVLRSMADFFAERCRSEYRLIALAEMSGKEEIRSAYSERELGEAIFSWLMEADSGQYLPERKQPDRAIHFGAQADRAPDDGEREDPSYACYMDNPGKRQAVVTLMNRMLEAQKPGEAYIFSDEDIQWLYEDSDFVRTIAEGVSRLTDKGWRFVRVAPQLHSIDQSFVSINCWLPAFMKNRLTQYFYPRLRDNLHRRTIFVADGLGAVSARSLADRKESYFTYICSDQKMLDVFMREMKDIIKLCRPSMCIHPAADIDDMLNCVERVEGIDDDETDRVASLSIPTMPAEITDRMLQRSGAPFIQKLARSYIRRARIRENSLRDHATEEIMVLADPETVLAGKAAILGTGIRPELEMYYTPREYCLHLQRIYDLMAGCGNYNAILINGQEAEDWVIHAKGSYNVLIIRENPPLAVCDVIDRSLAITFSDYLRRTAECGRDKCGREETMQKIRRMITILSA